MLEDIESNFFGDDVIVFDDGSSSRLDKFLSGLEKSLRIDFFNDSLFHALFFPLFCLRVN